MRAWLVVCAALALAPCRATAAHAHADPARLERIKSQILAKLGLTTRPTPLGAPPRDVVRQILARAADPHPAHDAHDAHDEHAMREVIAIAHRDKCSIACKGSPASQQYTQGQKYSYGVEGIVSIYLTGSAEKQETSVKLLGQVSVTAIGNCGHELAVQNLVISGPDGKKYQSPDGIDKPVQFSLQDGRLGAEICVEDGDTRRSLNIKRAIISLLQTEIKSNTQYDIFGACPTEISHSQEGGAFLVHRIRDLSRCAHREQGRNDLIASVFNPAAEIKESQILQSVLNVESKVTSGIPEKVSATEEYLYRPFAVGDNGARAKVHTKLTLTGKSAGGPQSHCTIPRSIIFENPHGDSVAPNNVVNALQAVKETARTVTSEANEKSAGSFAQVIRIFRSTSKDDLMKVFNQVKGNQLEKRVYLDGLFRTGTGPSIEASIQILKGHNLNDLEQHLVYLSLGNAKHVSDEALKAATSLLDQPNIPKEVYLGVGALGGAYCRQHRCHSTRSDGIAALSQKLAAKIGNCRQKTKAEEDVVVAVLKGIRNIRHLEDSLIDKLVHAALDHNVKARVKSAILEAFLADPCSAKIKKAGLDILKNRQLDSEIRIKAYLAVIACPCSKSASEIKNLLDTEPVHQVGRFITSSLRAIRYSSNPDKYLAKQHYGQIVVPVRFNIDDRKYSFYREQSFNVDALGIGGSIDETLIFSQDSFVPRSAAVNLTAQIFGHSFNVLEFGGRQGNLDLVLEHFFGPKGVFHTMTAQDLYDTFFTAYSENEAAVKAAMNRGRRSVKTEIDAFDKSLKAEAVPFDNELDLDIYMKLFGTDAVFLSLGNGKGFDFKDIVNQLAGIVSGAADSAKHLSKELRTHLLFLDAELAYPTSTGLPLRLDLTGAATARVDLSSNFDLEECLKSPQNAKIDVKIIPSTDIEISGVLLVDADSVATGLKVITNLHSSTGAHLVAKVLENGRGFDIQLGLPVDKQEILVASNELVYFTAEKGQREHQTKVKTENDQKKEYAGCFDQLSGLLGLTLCGEIVLPFAINGPENQASITKYLTRYPITGISKVKLVLEKNDLKGYHIRGVVREEGGRSSFELLFDAEGSKNRRTQLTGEKILTHSEAGIKLAFDSPIKTLVAEISAHRNPSELSGLARFKMDGQEYFGRVGFNIQGNERRSVYKPIFEYQVPDEQGKHSVQIDGQIVRENNGQVTKYNFEGIKLKLPSSQDPISVEGFFSTQANARLIQWALISEFLTVKGSLKDKDLELEFMNKLNPLINFILKGHSEFGDVIRNEVDIIHSGDCKDQSKRVIISQYLKYNAERAETFNVITKNKFEIVSVPFKIQFDADVDPKKIESDLQFAAPDQSARVELRARNHIKSPEDYSFKLLLAANKRELEVFSKRDMINADKSNFENFIAIKGVAKYELSGVVLHKYTPKDSNIGAIGHLKVTYGKTEDIKFDIGVIHNPSQYSSHAKVANNQGEILDYLLKITRGANASGQLKFVLKDAISASGQYKVTDSDGKGNGMVIVDFKKSQRKVKVDVKFVNKEPVFNADFDIFLNFEKDNNEKICFSTNNKITEKIVDSKNKLEYAGKTSELNIHKDGEYGVNGKTHANVEVVLPTERCLSFRVDRDIAVKDGVHNGNAQVSISDAPKRGAAASTITYRGKVVNTDYDKDTIDYEGQLDLKLKDGKNLQNSFTLKNVPQGGKFKFDFKTEVTGNILPKPASLTASATYLDSLSNADDSYNFKANYGSDIGMDIAGVLVVQLKDGADYKYVDDYTINVRLPFEKAHDLKFVNTIIFHQANGKDVLEYTIVESAQVNADVYKIDANGKVSPAQGTGTLKVLVPHVDPVILDVNYKHEVKGTDNVEVKARYGKGKSVTFNVDTAVTATGQDVNFKVNAPQMENLKKLEVTVHAKNPAPDTYASSAIVDVDGRVYKLETMSVLSKAHPIIDLQYTSPSHPKTSRIYIKGSSLSSTQGKIEAKIDNVRDVSLDLVSEASVQKDNVNFKIQAKSKELGFNNFVGEIVSKDAGSGKRLEFHSTNDGKNVLSGSTSFISKQEGQKTIIEGSGSVKIKEEQKSANFKYIRTILTEGNEKGVETFFNVALGERSYVAESRVTNLEYKNSHVYCEEKKQCAHAELQSKIDVSKPGVIANTFNAGFDLRKLGVAPELGLIIRDEISSSALPQYTLDLHANKDDRKYHLHVYNTPVYGQTKSGVRIQLPQRTMLLENSVSYYTNKHLPFPIKGELVLDLDKTRPGHKTAARFIVDLDVGYSDTKQSALVEIGFSHPKIDKEALIRVQGSAIRTGENNFKIESTALIAHSCLGRDREAKVLLEVSPNHFKFFINTPIVKVIDMEGTATVQEKLQKGELRFVLLDNKPVQVNALAKDYQYYELTTAEGDRKLSIVGHIDPEKRVDFTADIVLSGQKKNIAHGALFLEDNLVKSDYGLSKDNSEYFLKALRKDLDDLEARVKQLGEKAGNDLKDISQRAEPTLQKLSKAYSDDFGKIYKEIADDKVLQDLSQVLYDIAQFIAKLIDEVERATRPLVDKISQVYYETGSKIKEIYEKQIEPQVKQLYETIAKVLKEYLDGVIELVAHVAAIVADFFEKHKPELQELTNTIAEIFKDLTRLIVAQLKEFRAQAAGIVEEFINYLRDLPFIAAIKEKYAELAVPEQFTALVQQAHDTIAPLLPTPESQQFADALNDYIIKKLRKEKTDDSKELRVIYQRLITAVTSIVQFVRNQLGQYGVPTGPAFTGFGFIPSTFSSAPSFGGDAGISFLRQLFVGDLPSLSALVQAYRPRSFNILDEVPAKLRAVVVNGQHIFTFDGRHLTFPGSCRYVLAHDHVDRNFSLVLQLQDGKPKALAMEDKQGNVIELKDNGQVTLNGANHGYPVELGDTFAFRQVDGRIGIGTLYGLMAFCTSKLEVCYIEVNGFYLGKLRGLLGDGNNEPYDDFRLPNGKLCTSESEFGNAYRLARSCAAVTSPAHTHAQMHAPLPPACERVFGGTSPLRALSFVLDMAPFRQACIHAATGADALQQACDLARGYASLARTGALPAALPDACVRCADADRPRAVGETYEVKLPNKQADLVVAVETVKVNEKTFKELVVPLVSQIIEGLKAKRVTDIKVHLIGITSKFPYPVVYDTDIKLKNAKITFEDESRYDFYKPIKTDNEKVNQQLARFVNIINDIKGVFGLLNVEASYASVLDLPLRPGAVKHGMAVIGEACGPQLPFVNAIEAGFYEEYLRNLGMTTSLVTVTPNLNIGSGKTIQNVVGFDERHVLMLGDKKPSKESEALLRTLHYTDNSCIDFHREVGALILSSTNFFSLNPGQQKQFVQTASGSIVQELLHDTIEQACACAYVDPFRVRSVCITKSRKEAARRRK